MKYLMLSFQEFKTKFGAINLSENEWFNFYQDYSKQWTEIEQKKAELEKDNTDKIITQRYDFLKYFLGTFVLGLFSAITAYIIKDYELTLQTRKQDAETLAPYVDRYLKLMEQDNLGFKRNYMMCEFLSKTIIEKDLRAGFDTLTKRYKKRVDNEELIKKANEDSLKQQKLLKEEKLFALAEIQKNIKSITDPKAKQDILITESKIEKELEKISNKQALYQQVINQSISLLEPDPTIPVKFIDTQIKVEYSTICDEDRITGLGYYSEFANGVSVEIISISDTEATFRFWDENDVIVKDVVIKSSENKPIVVDLPDCKISVKLNSIKRKNAHYHIKIEKRNN